MALKKHLSETHPEVAAQWHPENNGKLTPSDVTYGSKKKVWWMCNKGHSWKANVYDRANGSGCPYCAGKKVCTDNCLATLRPGLVSEWHPTRNHNISPKDVTLKSGKKVWWVCSRGHEWQAKIQDRSRGQGCPFCSGRRASEINSLASKNPELIKEWHPSKNTEISPSTISYGSTRKVWWICKKGHEWQMSPNARTASNQGCPFCAGNRVWSGNSLATRYPEIASQWHTAKNGKFTPDQFSYGSKHEAWWRCNKGHEWKTTINERTNGGACPYCSNKKVGYGNDLQTQLPSITEQWHPEKNGDLKPSDFTPSSNKNVWWRCEKGHEWQARIGVRSRGQGCPFCSGKRVSEMNSLVSNFPELIKEWHPTRNKIDPNTISYGSTRKVWWICNKGHEWQMSPNARTSQNQGCPYCAGKRVSIDNSLAALYPDIVSEWHPTKNKGLTPDDVTKTSGKYAWWKCIYGHEWKAKISNRTALNSGCPFCSNQTSRIEIRLFTELKALFNDTKWRMKREGIEMDIFIPSIKLAIEVDGGYWHQDRIEEDTRKNANLATMGISVLRVRENTLEKISEHDIHYDEDEKHFNIVKRVVRTILDSIKIPDSMVKPLRLYFDGHGLKNENGYKKILSYLPAPPPEQSLASILHEIKPIWHPSKNAPLEAEMFRLNSHKLAWWTCDYGHEWQASIAHISNGGGCPYCSNTRVGYGNDLASVKPELAKEWHPSKNGILRPRDVLPGSGKKVWWKCKYGHEWEATVNSRNKGTGCPYCANRRVGYGNDLNTLRPDIADLWHTEKNGKLKPSDFTPGTRKSVWWRCEKGHEWKQKITDRTHSTYLCPKCKTKLKDLNEQGE